MGSDVVAVPLDRDVVLAEGPEAAEYLHGQVSQDVADMATGESRWSFVLQPQGKVDAFFRLTRRGDDAFVLDTDGGWGPAMTESLARFKMRTKVDFTPLDWRVVGLRGPGVAAMAGGAAGTEVVVPVDWPGVEGVDLLGPGPRVDGLAEIDADELGIRRIAAGMPAMGADIDDGTIPNETDLVELAVSFTKGCYRGQELVERIHSRGGNRQLLRRLRADAPVPAGAEIRADDGPVGTITSVAPGALGSVGLGYVRGALGPGDVVTIAWDGGSTSARIESLLPVS